MSWIYFKLPIWKFTEENYENQWCKFKFHVLLSLENSFKVAYCVLELLQIYNLFHEAWHITVSGLAKVAIFTTNVDAENQTLINHKCVCGALNRHFCQTRVMPSLFFFVRLSALAKTYSFAIFGCSVGWCELQMCMAFSVGIVLFQFNFFCQRVIFVVHNIFI